MEELTINIKDILEINNKQYRVLGFKGELISLCEINKEQLNVLLFMQNDLLDKLESFEIRKIDLDKYKVFDISALSDYTRNNFLKRKEIVNKVVEIYGPTYEAFSHKTFKPELQKIFEEHKDFTENTIRRYIRMYLQSGFDDSSLIDKRCQIKGKRKTSEMVKYGRKSDSGIDTGIPINSDVKTHFDEAIKECMSGRVTTKKSAFNLMLSKHYTETLITETGISLVLLPINKRPTLKQFLYYFNKQVSKKEFDEAKTSIREVRNSKRLLLSDSLKNITGPGALFEVDECEVDVSLVSVDNPNITIGRPIVYAMVDVYSRLVVAYSVSFENNSIIGLSNCFMNLLEDKQTLCKRFGIEIEKDDWPSMIIPAKIRSDYGSEYISKQLDRIMSEFQINKDVVTPGTGSLKGLVEQLFHQIQSRQNVVLENNGLIEKRHDSNHHKEAVMNINEFEAMLVASIVVRNKMYMSDYPLTKDMRNKDINPTPTELWKYGVSINGNPRPIGNEELFKYSLLMPVKASYSRAGVKFKDLYYINYSDGTLMAHLYAAGTKWIKLESARVDPRNVGNLYYLRDNKIQTLKLNPNKVGMIEWNGISLADYESYLKQKKNKNYIGAEENTKLEVALLHHNKQLVHNAKGYGTKSIDTNLRENRAIEKQKRRLEEQIVKEGKTESPKKIEAKQEEEFYIPKDIFEALERFKEDEWKD